MVQRYRDTLAAAAPQHPQAGTSTLIREKKRFTTAIALKVYSHMVAAPSLSRDTERQFLAKQGVRYIVGVDEAGRGPLAGPVVAAACIIEAGVELEGINDSKTTSEQNREATYETLVNTEGVYWGVAVIPSTTIDEINILQATLLGMRTSTEQIFSKYPHLKPEDVYGLIDGNKVPLNMPVSSEFVIKGDSIVHSIAAASIIAKVTRDRIMLQLDKLYPHYNFAKHKGYPVPDHRFALANLGPCPEHRFSYTPVKQAAVRHDYPIPQRAAKTKTSSSMSPPQSPPSTPIKVKVKVRVSGITIIKPAAPAPAPGSGGSSSKRESAAGKRAGGANRKGKVAKTSRRVMKSPAPTPRAAREAAQLLALTPPVSPQKKRAQASGWRCVLA